MFCTLFSLGFSLSPLHNTFDNEQSKMVIRLWRPEIFVTNDDVFFKKEKTENFIKARLFLEKKNTFSIASLYEEELTILLCVKYPEKHKVIFYLWTSDIHREYIIKNIEKWHENTFPNVKLDMSLI